MTEVTKSGFGFWKKTIVTHNGKTDVYKGNATVEKNGNSTCITEKGILTENSTCYMESSKDSDSSKGSLPDGVLVGKSKSIVVESPSGNRREYKSGILSIKSMEKHGDQIQIVQNGVFGKKVIDTFSVDEVSKIESEDCNVCKSTNPFYKD